MNLYQRVGDELLERLEYFQLSPRWVLDVSASDGAGERQLQRRYSSARVLSVHADQAPRVRARSAWPWRRAVAQLRAAATALPLATHSIDLICSNLLLARCSDLGAALREFARVLSPGGLLMLSTLGPESPDPQPDSPPDLQRLGAELMRAGFRDAVIDVERYTEHQGSPAVGEIEVIYGTAFARAPGAARPGAEAAEEHTVPVSAVRRPRQ